MVHGDSLLAGEGVRGHLRMAVGVRMLFWRAKSNPIQAPADKIIGGDPPENRRPSGP